MSRNFSIFFVFYSQSEVLSPASFTDSFSHCHHDRRHWGETQFTSWAFVWASMQGKWAQEMEGAGEHDGERIWMMCNVVMNGLSWLVLRARYWWKTITFFSQGNITSKGFWNLVDKWKNRSKQMAWQKPETQMEITMTSCALVSLVSRDMVINEWDMSDHDWAVVKQVSLNTRKNISCRCIASEIYHIFFCQGSHIMNLIYNSVRPE